MNKKRNYLNTLAELGCYCCRAEGIESPAMIHHIREGMGMGQRAPDIGGTIPLCEGHHQGNFDTSKLAFHRNPKLWREKYGSEKDIAKGLFELVCRLGFKP